MKSYFELLSEATYSPPGTTATWCDFLSKPTSEELERLVASSDVLMKAFLRSDKVRVGRIRSEANRLSQWFLKTGGNKVEVIDVLRRMASCGNRASWARYSGKAYRGFPRRLSEIMLYDYTGQSEKVGMYADLYFTARARYVSKYAAQSWTAEWRMAQAFSRRPLGDRNYPVIAMAELSDAETVLSPEVSNRISGTNEDEVIRVGNEPKPIILYVEARKILDQVLAQTKLRARKIVAEAEWMRKRGTVGMMSDRQVEGLVHEASVEILGKTVGRDAALRLSGRGPAEGAIRAIAAQAFKAAQGSGW